MDKGGYLELILGCMWAGKSTKLQALYNKYKLSEQNPIIINYCSLQNTNNTMVTHDNTEIECVYVSKLNDIYNIYDTSKDIKLHNSVYLINEGQFFPDIYVWVKHMVNNLNKTIYIAALDGDYKKVGFTQILELIPECDKIEKLPAICTICKDGTYAIFTKRKTSNKERIIVNDNIYQPLCRKCYNKSI